MTDLRELLRQAAQRPAPASPLVADELFAAGRRRHRRRRVTAGSAAAFLAVAAALTVTGTLTAKPGHDGSAADDGVSAVRQQPRPGVSGPGAIIQWAGATDADHLYLAYLHCDRLACHKGSFDLVGSDDGGHTWSDRASGLAADGWRVVGPGTVLAMRESTIEHPLVSVDGGRTWSGLTVVPATKMVPDGGTLICHSASTQAPCRLFAVDPGAGLLAPLSGQPALTLQPSSSIVDAVGRLWVSGTDRASVRPAVAVSLDRGRTWSAHVFTGLPACATPSCDAPALATADGRTVYATMSDTAGQRRVVYRSDDGRAWSRVDAGDVPYGRGAGWSFVASDGSHIICVLGRRGQRVDRCDFRAAKGGAGYRRIELPGLPAAVGEVRRTPDGWYYTVSYAPTYALFGSSDGLHWSRIAGG